MSPSVRPVSMALAACALVVGTAALTACSTPDNTASPAANAARAASCSGASLAMAGDTVVGKLDGQPILWKDLGADAVTAEEKALFEYCDAVHASRAQALDNYVMEKLVDKAAKAAGQESNVWMQAEVQKRIPQPSDADIQAFYDARKRPGAPTLEEVKGQVVMVMQREKSEDAVREVLESLKKGVVVEKTLPDVRPPARDIAVTAHTARKGAAQPKVKVIEFADYQCPYCSMAATAMKELEAKYGEKVEFAYRHFPLRSIHPNAQRAAEFAQCSLAQGKFWELHEKLYADQDKLDEASLRASAGEVGLDAAKLEECLTSGKGATEVEEDVKAAEALGVQGTPTFFINGRQHSGAATVEALAAVIEGELK